MHCYIYKRKNNKKIKTAKGVGCNCPLKPSIAIPSLETGMSTGISYNLCLAKSFCRMEVFSLLCTGVHRWMTFSCLTYLLRGRGYDGLHVTDDCQLQLCLPPRPPFSPTQESHVNLSEMIMGTAFSPSLCIRKVNHPHCVALLSITVRCLVLHNWLYPGVSKLQLVANCCFAKISYSPVKEGSWIWWFLRLLWALTFYIVLPWCHKVPDHTSKWLLRKDLVVWVPWCPPKRYVQVFTPCTNECNLI